MRFARCVTKRSLIAAFLTCMALVMFLHSVSVMNFNFSSKIHERAQTQLNNSCEPQRKIAFLKAHKCASSTMQNMLFRYGEKYNLLFALPSENYFGDGKRYISRGMIDSMLVNRLGYDIIAAHGKWNITAMKDIMGPDAVLITIIRDPIELFYSLYSYTHLGKGSVQDYIENNDVNGQRKSGYLGFNQMTWDFGLPPGQFKNSYALNALIKEADDSFHLVMVAERLPESLVLLRRLLCAKMEDVVVLTNNARNEALLSKRPKLNNRQLSLLKKKLEPDYQLYNHFNKKLDALVNEYGREQMAKDIVEYDHTSLKVMQKCGFQKVNGKDIKAHKAFGREMIYGYKTNSSDYECVAMTSTELDYFDRLRANQKKRVMKSLKMKLNDVKQLGGVPLGGVNMNEVLKNVRKTSLNARESP